MKLIILLAFFLFSNFVNAQINSFSFEINNSNNNFFYDFLIDSNNNYIINYLEGDINPNSADYGKYKNQVIKIDSQGKNPMVLYSDTFNNLVNDFTTVSYDGSYFTISTVRNTPSDSMRYLRITKNDGNFNLINQYNFFNITGKQLHSGIKTYLVDSTLVMWMGFIIGPSNSFKFYTLYLEINLNTMAIIKQNFFSEPFFCHDILHPYNNKDASYVFAVSLFGNNGLGHSNVIVRYDSLFQLVDTINMGYELNSNTNIIPWKDSKYIISGRGIDFWDPNNYPSLTRKLRIQIVDSNFRFLAAKSYSYCDSTNARPGYVQNLVKNKLNQYFVGAYLEDNYLKLHPEAGILIVKLDSNLNTIWQKHIPGNAHYRLARLRPTDDGGVVFIIVKNPVNSTNYNGDAALVKLGPNGELTSYTNLSNLSLAQINLYPNPASKYITIESIQASQRIILYTLYDMQGKALQSKQLNSRQVQIDIEHLSKGVYLIQGRTTDGTKFSQKFIKE